MEQRKTSRLRALAANALLACFSLALGFLALEVALRLFYPQLLDLDLRRWVAVDAELRHAFKPNLHASVLQRDLGTREPFEFFTDERGLRRGREPRPLVREGGANYVFFGDSQTWGWGVNYEETYPAATAGILARDTGAAHHALNAGVCGYGPDNSLLLLKRLAPELRPDAGFFAVYVGNDFWDVEDSRMFGLDESGGLVRNESFRATETARERARNQGRATYLKYLINSRLHTARFLAERTRELRFAVLGAPPSTEVGGAVALQPFLSQQEQVYFSPVPEEAARARRVVGLLLLEARDAFRETWGKSLVVLALPSPHQVKNLAPAVPPGYEADLDAPSRFLREWCAEHGVLLVDFLEPMRRAHGEGAELFLKDGHYAPAGHRLVAEHLALAIRGGVLDESAVSAP